MLIDGDWVFLAVLVVASVSTVLAARRRITDSQLLRWSLRFDVVVDANSRKFVSTRLRRARLIRWTSFMVGINVSLLPMYVNVIDAGSAGRFSNPAGATAPWAAAALGAVLAEVWVVQRPFGPRVADVTPRRWRDYADQRWVIAVAACLPVAITAAVIATADAGFRWAWSWVGPASVVCALIAVTVGVQRVVDRPALAAAGQDRLLDGALRADGAHHVLGASVALAGMGTFQSLIIAAGASWLALVFVVGEYLVLGRWHSLACTDRWNVQRARLMRA